MCTASNSSRRGGSLHVPTPSFAHQSAYRPPIQLDEGHARTPILDTPTQQGPALYKMRVPRIPSFKSQLYTFRGPSLSRPHLMPPSTEDPSWSADHSSKASLLTLTNDSDASLVSTRRRRSSRLTWTGLLTTLFVFALTAGPATALVGWILRRQFDGRQEYGTSLFDALRKDSFIVDEGFKEANAGTSQTTSALRALTISSFAVRCVLCPATRPL